jgi:hypothetical protein
MGADGILDVSCLHGQLICYAVVDSVAKGEPNVVALRILRGTSLWESLISFRYFRIKVVMISKKKIYFCSFGMHFIDS